MSQGYVIALVTNKKGVVQEQSMSFYSMSDNPIKRAEQVAGQFKNGMKGWGKDRKEFGQSIVDAGLTLKFVPIIV